MRQSKNDHVSKTKEKKARKTKNRSQEAILKDRAEMQHKQIEISQNSSSKQ
jgi:hypothetical protein